MIREIFCETFIGHEWEIKMDSKVRSSVQGISYMMQCHKCGHVDLCIMRGSPHVRQPDAIKLYDHLPAEQAVLAAWVNPGLSLEYHRVKRNKVIANMPVLARALDRLAVEGKRPKNWRKK